MLVTLEGMLTFVSPVQSSNAASPMLVTLEGMVTQVSPLLSWNAPYPMLVTGYPFTDKGNAIMFDSPELVHPLERPVIVAVLPENE
jgi:hypothetical protein